MVLDGCCAARGGGGGRSGIVAEAENVGDIADGYTEVVHRDGIDQHTVAAMYGLQRFSEGGGGREGVPVPDKRQRSGADDRVEALRGVLVNIDLLQNDRIASVLCREDVAELEFCRRIDSEIGVVRGEIVRQLILQQF